MTVSDEVLQTIVNANACFEAGMKAGREETQRKLDQLIATAEGVVARLEIYYDDTDRVRFERDRLRTAIREAR